MLKIAVIQMNSQSDKPGNLRAIAGLVDAAVERDQPDWVLLPEHCEWLGGSAGAPAIAEPHIGGETYQLLAGLARRHRIWIHGGSFYEAAGKDRAYNTSVVFDRTGREVERYRKIHLFDVTTADGARYHESATVEPGDHIAVYDCEGIRVGCSICYDVRFPELYQALAARGAELIAVPAAFTLLTGKDHWETLLRARAIETGCWVAAAVQWGSYPTPAGERHSFGQSLIADPWGHVLARVSDGIGFASTHLDPAVTARVRGQIPVLANKAIGVRVQP